MFKIIDFYVFSNLHVAVAAFSFTKLSLLFYNNHSNEIPLFVLFATFLAYNFLRIYDLNNCLDQWLCNWIQNHLNKIVYCLIVAFFLILYMSFSIDIKVLLWFVPMVLLTLLYIIPIVRVNSKTRSFRMFPYLKIVYVVIIWTFSTTVIPIISMTYFEFNTLFLLYSVSKFLLFLALIIPFEIRDLSYDASYLRTLPQVVGIFNTKLIGVLLLLGVATLNFFIYIDSKDLFISSIIIILTFFFLINASNNQSNYYSAFWVEGIPIFWLILVEL